MNWVVFSYSMSAQSRSSPRVTLWRRLRRVGAVSPAGGVYVLPARDECIEAFQWLAQEIRQAKGEALVMRIEQFEGLTEGELTALFNTARAEEYAEIAAEITALEKASKPKERAGLHDAIEKLRKRQADIARVDYFGCPEGAQVAARLAELAQTLAPERAPAPQVAATNITTFRDKTWVTRPRPHVDRLACAWFIRRFINPKAVIHYSLHPKPNEIAFDMEKGQFGHRGNLCTFETMILAFGLNDNGLSALAEIAHEIDLRDGKYVRPAEMGIDFVLQGWLRARLSDAELEQRGVALFEGLYIYFSQTRGITKASEAKPSPRRRR